MIHFCKYKNIFGQPNKSLHSIRLFNIALIDLFGLIFGAHILKKLFLNNYYFSFIFLFLLGIFLHRLFCVKTTIDKLLFN